MESIVIWSKRSRRRTRRSRSWSSKTRHNRLGGKKLRIHDRRVERVRCQWESRPLERPKDLQVEQSRHRQLLGRPILRASYGKLRGSCLARNPARHSTKIRNVEARSKLSEVGHEACSSLPARDRRKSRRQNRARPRKRRKSSPSANQPRLVPEKPTEPNQRTSTNNCPQI